MILRGLCLTGTYREVCYPWFNTNIKTPFSKPNFIHPVKGVWCQISYLEFSKDPKTNVSSTVKFGLYDVCDVINILENVII